MQMIRLRLETAHLARTMQNQQQASLRGVRSLPPHLTSDVNPAAAGTASQQRLQLGQLASAGSEESAAVDQWHPQGVQTQQDARLAVTWARDLFGPTARRPARGRAGKGGATAARGTQASDAAPRQEGAGAAEEQASGAGPRQDGAATEAAAPSGLGAVDGGQAEAQPPPAGDSSAGSQPAPGRPGSTRRRGTQSLSPGRTAEAAPAASVSPRRPWRAGTLSRYMEPAPGLGLDLGGTTAHRSR